MSKEKDREAILARRKLFIASALASIAATTCEKPAQACLSPPPQSSDASTLTQEPQVCLAVATSTPEPPPEPCLTVAMPPPDASGDAGTDAGKQPPRVCLSPRPCLKPVPPKSGDPFE